MSAKKNLFGKQARWMDYSGSIVVGKGDERKVVSEGITYFDHPDNRATQHIGTFEKMAGWALRSG